MINCVTSHLNFKFLILMALWAAPIWKAQAKVSPEPFVIAVLDAGPETEHEKKIQEVIKTEIHSCVECKTISFPIYNKSGDLYEKQFLKSIALAQKSSARVINLSWNMPYEKHFDKIILALSRLAQLKNKILVVSAGAPTGAVVTAPLSESVIGKVKDAIIIGEKGDRGQLVSQSWYGPEIFTLVRNEKYRGSSFSSAEFSGKLLKTWSLDRKASKETVLKKMKQEFPTELTR